MKEIKNMAKKVIRLLVPIMGLEIIIPFSQEKVSSIKINDDLEILSFEPNISSQNTLLNDTLKLGNGDTFKIKGKYFLMGGDENINLNARFCFLLKYIDTNSDGVMLMPHHAEPHAREFLTLMRLFQKGDIYTPVIFFEKYSVFIVSSEYYVRDHGFESLVIYQHEISALKKYLNQTKDNLSKIENLYKKDLLNNPTISNAYKRLNNSIYFFNKSFFTTEDGTSINPGFRKGNIDRLINLIVALEALFGFSSEIKDIISCLNSLLKNQKYDKIIKHFYDLRSSYLHANPFTLVSKIEDKEVDQLRKITRDAIISYIVLLSNNDFINKIIKTQEKQFPKLLQSLASGNSTYLDLIDLILKEFPKYHGVEY